MRIAITGGTGFLAGRIAEDLTKRGNFVSVFSRKLDPILTKNCVPQTLIDWNSESSLRSICEGHDVIIHAAGMSSQECERDPASGEHFNGRLTSKLAAVASTSGVRKFIYISTAHVYSQYLEGTFQESCEPLNKSPYATSHLSGEIGVLNANDINGMKSIVVRAGNVYGAPANSNISCMELAINQFYFNALRENRIVIRSNPSLERNFIPALDFCAHIGFILTLEDLMGLNIINVGAPESHSLNHMANAIARDLKIRNNQNVEIIKEFGHAVPRNPFTLSTEKLMMLGGQNLESVELEFERMYIYFNNLSIAL